ncbi:MAG: hypothetical protein ACD_24C00444G0002 [uncultured bacterium]|uniref:Uncharacterized protein n=1 Tax=candidate division WWE3 bacterium RBG_16_37_10 TaxID=1802610 RepID=A0A1F4V406_UNCKA|nr:MAG: hypothetical protein ACD_24C00444G0002 [uncultured bacterium]OGC51931.1 MAG: hypothetical protein A2W32_01440 [candidate division WWE3 bacterium RBG_16_37_10]
MATTDYVRYGFDGKKVVIPQDIETDGLMGSLSVAHEIGRLRHKEYIEIQVDIYDKLKRLGLMEEVDISEYIKMCLDIYRLDIELEKEG